MALRNVEELMSEPVPDAERRHPWEIALDNVQLMDYWTRFGDFPSYEAKMHHVEVCQRMVLRTIDAKVGERVAMRKEAELELATLEVTSALAHAIDSCPELTVAQRTALFVGCLDYLRPEAARAASAPLPALERSADDVPGERPTHVSRAYTPRAD